MAEIEARKRIYPGTLLKLKRKLVTDDNISKVNEACSGCKLKEHCTRMSDKGVATLFGLDFTDAIERKMVKNRAACLKLEFTQP